MTFTAPVRQIERLCFFIFIGRSVTAMKTIALANQKGALARPPQPPALPLVFLGKVKKSFWWTQMLRET